LSSEEICVKLISEKVFPVNNLQDAPVKVYPYYDPCTEMGHNLNILWCACVHAGEHACVYDCVTRISTFYLYIMYI